MVAAGVSVHAHLTKTIMQIRYALKKRAIGMRVQDNISPMRHKFQQAAQTATRAPWLQLLAVCKCNKDSETGYPRAESKKLLERVLPLERKEKHASVHLRALPMGRGCGCGGSGGGVVGSGGCKAPPFPAQIPLIGASFQPFEVALRVRPGRRKRRPALAPRPNRAHP